MHPLPLVSAKPKLRGHFHQASFFVSLGACSLLIAKAHGTRTRAAAVIYACSLCGLFGVSALYHRPQWKPEFRVWMRRFDHAAIFILIAGTATPIALLAMPDLAGMRFFKVLWLSATAGVLLSVFWVDAPKWITAVVAVGVGSMVFPFISDLRSALSSSDLFLILCGGLLYILGAIIYALKRPNPAPLVFGYHEIFHGLVVIAAVLHFFVIYLLIN